MEVFNQEVLNHEALFVDRDNPFDTCARRELGKDECYMYVPTYLSQTRHMDFVDIFAARAQAGGEYHFACISGVGSEAMKRNMSKPEEVFNLCGEAGSLTNQASCVFGVVSMYLNQEGTDAGGEALCRKAPLQYQMLCNSVVESEREFF